MGGSLHVHSIEDEIILKLNMRALRNGRSAEAEHREILRQVLSSEPNLSFDELAAELRAMIAERDQTLSEILQREGRDER